MLTPAAKPIKADIISTVQCDCQDITVTLNGCLQGCRQAQRR